MNLPVGKAVAPDPPMPGKRRIDIDNLISL